MALALANFLQNNKGSKIGKDLLEAYKNSYKNYYPLWGRVRDFSVPMKMAFENKVTTHHCPESLTRIAPLVLMYGKGSGLKSTIQHEVTLTNSSIESLYMAEFLGNLLTKLIYGSPKCLDGRQASLPILISDLTITVPSHSNTYEVLMMVLSKCDFNTTMRDKFHLYKNDLFVFGRALIAVIESDSFESAIKKSIELSKAHFHYETNNERDTATICGQIAGAYYGYKKIPQSMIDTLGRKDIIQTVLEPML
jgi:ADP-ribosylglycohydrolase